MNPRKIIVKYGLALSSQREMSMLGVSSVFLAYTKLMKRSLGYGYNAIGAFERDGTVNFIMNEKDLNAKTEKYLKKHRLVAGSKVFKDARELYARSRQFLLWPVEKVKKSPAVFLASATEHYPRFMQALGVYNVFWKYTASGDCQLPKAMMNMVGKTRGKIAEVYPMADKLIVAATDVLGKECGVSAKILRRMTVAEMKEFLKTRHLNARQKRELAARAKGYLYLSENECRDEAVFADKELITAIHYELSAIGHGVREVKGMSVYPGCARGRVRILPLRRAQYPVGKYILVANSTHPKYVSLIKKCAGIVTEEGGMLCHAAIIARELKIPCVVGTKIATRIFKDGDRVKMDANRGVVKRI